MRNHLIISSLALAAATGAASAQEACSTYEIQRGDSLRELAIQVYSTEDYRIIYEANRDIIGSNPNIIRVGDILTFPCLEDVGREAALPDTEAGRIAAEMAAELVKAAEERAEKAIEEAEARVAAAEAEAKKASEEAVIEAKAAAKKEIEAARAEGAALIRNADQGERPEIRDR
ncbi:MAG: LysM peptidoglycan-binding domain-containing protein, partial [Leisingera sp.]